MPGVTPDGTEHTPSDAVLIRRFAASADQGAFATLVRRHGPLVMGVCRRQLHNQHHAEDAFQATFLVLAQKAGKVRWRRSLANWLHRVAYGVCLNARRRIARRRETELTMDAQVVDESLDIQSFQTLALREEMFVFDEELAQLPERYRAVLVLFYLEGKSRDEVAQALGLTLAAVKSRLERGRRRLRLRLVLRGVALGSAVVLLHQSQHAAAAAVTESLINATAQAGVSFATGTSIGPTTPDQIVSLAEGQIRTMTWTTYTTKGALAVTGLVSAVVLTITLGGQAADKDDPFATTATLEASQNTPAATAEANIVATTTVPRSRGAKGKRSGGNFTPQLSEQEEDILSSLDDVTNVDFQEAELSEVMAYLSEVHGIDIVLDKTELEDAGLGTDVPVTASFDGIRLRSALRMILRPSELMSTVTDDVLLITTPEALPGYARIRTYHVPELIAADWDADGLVDMLSTMFDDIDGETIVGSGDQLVVRATVETHQQIEQVLDQLQAEE